MDISPLPQGPWSSAGDAQPCPDTGLAALPAHLVGRYIRLQQLVLFQQVVHRSQIFAVILRRQKGFHLAARRRRERPCAEHVQRSGQSWMPGCHSGVCMEGGELLNHKLLLRLLGLHQLHGLKGLSVHFCQSNKTQAPMNLTSTAKGRVTKPSQWYDGKTHSNTTSRKLP